MGALVSYFNSLRASAYYGAALKQNRKGNYKKALEKAEKGLLILSKPKVVRTHFSAASVLMHLTMLVEQISHETATNGACEKDLSDTYLIIKDQVENNISQEYAEWLPYITSKLGYEPKA